MTTDTLPRTAPAGAAETPAPASPRLSMAEMTEKAIATRRAKALVFDPKRMCGSHRRPARVGGCHGGKGCTDTTHLCLKAKGWATDHVGFGNCKFHGGNAPNGKKHAAAEAAAALALKFGIEIEVGPIEALLGAVRQAAGTAAFLRQRAQDDEATSSERELYGVWMDRLVKYAKAAVDAGVAEAQVRLAERQAEVVIRAVTAALDAAGVKGKGRLAAEQAVVAELRAAAPAGAELS